MRPAGTYNDAAIKLFSPETDLEAIPPRKAYWWFGYFRKGESARLCPDQLQHAGRQPGAIAFIVDVILTTKNLPGDPNLRASVGERAATYLRDKCRDGENQKLLGRP